MKARKVKGLDPSAPLADNAERIVRVRLDELGSFMPRAADPSEVEALHDMRIAAKRLRYLLEVMRPVLGGYAGEAARRARALQDVLGEVHDCDVMLPRVHAELDALDTADGPRDDAYRGLAVLAADLRTRRAERFRAFRDLWARLEDEGYADRLNAALPTAG